MIIQNLRKVKIKIKGLRGIYSGQVIRETKTLIDLFVYRPKVMKGDILAKIKKKNIIEVVEE